MPAYIREQNHVRQVVLEGQNFYWAVFEKPDQVVFRSFCKQKTSFLEVAFTYQSVWKSNLCHPEAAYRITKYAVNNGWQFYKRNSKLNLSKEFGAKLVQLLDLENIF